MEGRMGQRKEADDGGKRWKEKGMEGMKDR